MAAPIAWLRKNGEPDLANAVELIVLERIVQHYVEQLDELRQDPAA